MVIKVYDSFNRITGLEIEKVAKFLHTHLGKYGDDLSSIRKAIEYALKDRAGLGGKVLLAFEEDEIIGAVVVNKTGMEGYIPENILVYIASHADHRGKGVGKKLMEATIEHSPGDIALHVEHNNPAKHLYEKLGFKNPYLEMRLKR